MIILLLGLLVFITALISIFILSYFTMGLFSPESNVQIEAKVRKFLNKPPVIIIDSASYIRQRNSKFVKWFLLIHLIVDLLFIGLFQILSTH
jgi:hypothetical protein